MFPSFSDLVTCFHSLLQLHRIKRAKGQSSTLGNTCDGSWPGFGPSLSLHGPQPLLGDGKFVRVDDFGFSAAVGEFQSAVPLALSFGHDGVGGVVFDLRCHSVARERWSFHWVLFIQHVYNKTVPRCFTEPEPPSELSGEKKLPFNGKKPGAGPGWQVTFWHPAESWLGKRGDMRERRERETHSQVLTVDPAFVSCWDSVEFYPEWPAGAIQHPPPKSSL